MTRTSGTPMRGLLSLAAPMLVVALNATPAWACAGGPAPLRLDAISSADIVVIGRIENYRTFVDPARRQRRVAWFETQRLRADPDQAPSHIEDASREASVNHPDAAHFDVLVDEVLKGRSGPSLSAWWDPSWHGFPVRLPSGPVLVALRQNGSGSNPRFSSLAPTDPGPDLAALVVLRAPCAPPFLFESTGAEAATIRSLLALGASPPARPAWRAWLLSALANPLLYLIGSVALLCAILLANLVVFVVRARRIRSPLRPRP